MSNHAAEYAQKLIEKGIDPDTAKIIARKQVIASQQNHEKKPTLISEVLPVNNTKEGETTKKTTVAVSEPELIEPPSTVKPTTRANKALISASVEIMTNPPSGNDMSFNHGILCQVGLPRKKVEGSSFLRKSGDVWVHVQSGFLDEGNGPVEQPIPYGAMPRLALAWVSTYAVRNNTSEIPIGSSASEFLRLMGLDSQGNRYKTLKLQMHALAACRLQMGFKGRTYNSQPVERFDAWHGDAENIEHQTAWPGQLKLSEGFYNMLMESPVPLDGRALAALRSSALALDIYCWLAHRLHRISGRPLILHWASIREQFAQEYAGKNATKDFKKSFITQLNNVLMVYPKAKVKQVKGGIMLMSSPPPIPFKGF